MFTELKNSICRLMKCFCFCFFFLKQTAETAFSTSFLYLPVTLSGTDSESYTYEQLKEVETKSAQVGGGFSGHLTQLPVLCLQQ